MSRLSKRPIAIPSGVEVSVEKHVLTVKGPKGALEKGVHRDVVFETTPEGVLISPKKVSVATQALPGTFAAHLKNMITGVTAGFTRRLLIEGVGFRWEVSGTTLKLSLGFSHPVVMTIPEGVTAALEKNTLVLSGIDKEKVGQFAAEIRAMKKPEPYKGKGIRYEGEVVRRKQGKKTS